MSPTFRDGQVCECGGWMPLKQDISIGETDRLYLYQCNQCREVDLHYSKRACQPVREK